MLLWRRIHARPLLHLHNVTTGSPKTRFCTPLFTRGLATPVLDMESAEEKPAGLPRPQHAVISTFDLFSVGVGPSSSHTVGPMRAGRIFVNDLRSHDLLDQTKTVKVVL
jgi:hypothetical protein